MSFHVKDNFTPGSPVSSVPSSWFNDVARFLNNLVGGLGINVRRDSDPPVIELDPGELKAAVSPLCPNAVDSANEALDTQAKVAALAPKKVTEGDSSETAAHKIARIGTSKYAARADHTHTLDDIDLESHTHGNITNDGKITASGKLGYILANALADGAIVTSQIKTADLNAVMADFSVTTSGGNTTAKLKPDKIKPPSGASAAVLYYDGAHDPEWKTLGGTGADDVAAGNHTHSDYVATNTVGTSSGPAAFNHAHDGMYQPFGVYPSHSHDIGDLTDEGGVIASAVNDAISDALSAEGLLDGVLFDDDIGSSVQEHSDELDLLVAELDSNGKVPLSMLYGNISGHSGNCLVTIDNSGNLSHSGNAAFNQLMNAVYSSVVNLTARLGLHKLITDLDVGDGIEADSSTHNLKVKCRQDGGITADSNGLQLGSLGSGSADKYLKTDSYGSISVASDNPVTLASGLTWSSMFSTTTDANGNRILYFHVPTFDADGKLTGFASANTEIFRAGPTWG